MRISGRAKVAGVVGDPVAHSLSPHLHAYWLEAYDIDGAYVPLAVARESFSIVVRGLRAAGFVGVNVTVPHKEAAFALADRHDAHALAVGAVNLLVFHRDHVEGRNTDAAGLSASLVEKLGTDFLRGKSAAILGAGGAARAAVLALNDLGAAEIRIFSRTATRAEALAHELGASTKARLQAISWTEWPNRASGVTLLLNATSGGMSGKQALDLALDPLPAEAVVCDIVYNPLDTALLAKARARGHAAIDGLGMLMHQAVPAFSAFYGATPAVTPALRQELEEALREGR